MNKIKEIVLINFQRYKKLTIPIDKGFNCIVGNNNEGKSSIERALEWIFTNAPAGDWMRRIDEQGNVLTATAKLIFDNDIILKRVKGKDKNYYAINENEYHEVGRKIPVEVQELLAINRELFEEIKELPQIDSQDAPPFLVLSKNTDKARALNLLTGMTDAENAIKKFNADKMNHSREITFNNKKIDDITENLKDFRFLKVLPMKKMNRIAQRLAKSTLLISDLTILHNQLKECNTTIKEYEVLRSAYKHLEAMDELNKGLISKKVTLMKIKDAYTKFNDIKASTKDVPDIDFDAIQLQVGKLIHKRSRLLKLRQMKDTHDDIVDDYGIHFNEATKLKKELAGKVCPMCSGKGKL